MGCHLAKQLSPAGIMALKEALCSVYWYKSELRGFLQLCLSNPAILNNFNWENYKRQIASDVVDYLVANPDSHLGDLSNRNIRPSNRRKGERALDHLAFFWGIQHRQHIIAINIIRYNRSPWFVPSCFWCCRNFRKIEPRDLLR